MNLIVDNSIVPCGFDKKLLLLTRYTCRKIFIKFLSSLPGNSLKHCHITNTSLSLLVPASFPLRFWGEAFVVVVNIINVLPTSMLHNHIRYEILFDKKLGYPFFKVFGCACYPFLRPYNKYKFYFISSICLFLGYSSKHKGYICLSISRKTYIIRHVIFNENLLPYSHSNNPFAPFDPNTHLYTSYHHHLIVIHHVSFDINGNNSTQAINNTKIPIFQDQVIPCSLPSSIDNKRSSYAYLS